MLQKARPAPIIFTLVLHVVVIVVLLLPGQAKRPPQVSAISWIDVANAPASPAAPEPLPAPPPPTPEPLVVPPQEITWPSPSALVATLLEQADLKASGGACDLTGPVQAALRSSEAVRATLPRIPRGDRSVANAIMVWNVDWMSGGTRLDVAALAAIRDEVAGTVAAATPDCREQPQRGPRLIVLSEAGRNTVLALGSGQWRWQDVLDSALSQRVNSPPQVPASN